MVVDDAWICVALLSCQLVDMTADGMHRFGQCTSAALCPSSSPSAVFAYCDNLNPPLSVIQRTWTGQFVFPVSPARPSSAHTHNTSMGAVYVTSSTCRQYAILQRYRLLWPARSLPDVVP